MTRDNLMDNRIDPHRARTSESTTDELGRSTSSARQILRLVGAAVVVVLAAAVAIAVAVLAIIHVDDRYGVSAASGVWMGLSSALLDGVFYPPIYDGGFYGGTRYMPLPFAVEAGAAWVTGELLVSAKLSIYAVAGGLYALVYIACRRRGAPLPIAAGLIAAIIATAAGLMTSLGIRWDALATLLQLAALIIVVDHERSRRRAALAGLLCALALTAKISALWAPVTLVIWLAIVSRQSLRSFIASLIGTTVALAAAFHILSSGRFTENVRLFTFGGSDSAAALDGVQRLYQFALRDQREGAVLLVLACVGVVIATVRRRLGPYEIGFVVSAAVLLVLMRDAGVYENHLLDLLVLTSIVVAGMWRAFPEGRMLDLVQAAVVLAIVAGTILAVRYTLVPDIRAALSHELRGKADSRFATDPVARMPGAGTCELFQDASIPLLAGDRPIVLDAFMLHRLQTRRPAPLNLLVRRVERRAFNRIVLTTPLTDVGWFALLDFGSLLADAMRKNYTLAAQSSDRSLWVYVPKRQPSATAPCPRRTLSEW